MVEKEKETDGLKKALIELESYSLPIFFVVITVRAVVYNSLILTSVHK